MFTSSGGWGASHGASMPAAAIAASTASDSSASRSDKSREIRFI
ncbi:hypothetical protein BN871_CN_00340 [Paenibacillus sp. P22]|nr:hypothetical protein BN871_CN_00340 [Paenibacillus sp. P22]